jgi:Arc/MetJ-type ribon-helix-helix transcriptional regulator
MAKPFNDKKLGLGEPLARKLRDFCAANYRASALDVIREALDEHIERRLQNPEMKARYEHARRVRLELPEKVVTLVKKKEQP